MTPTIRLATADDAVQMLAIYAPIVRTTVISFEVDPPSVAEMRQQIDRTLAFLPWLVCAQRDAILGFAYAGSVGDRTTAYGWSAEVSIYVHPDQRRTGIGRALYATLLRILEQQGFCNAFAGITLPNLASVGLHESLGFRHAVTYGHAGYKFGAWRDVGWWQLALPSHRPHPSPPQSIASVQSTQI